MPRPKFEPAAQDRKTVETMAAFGIPEDEIARAIGGRGIDPKTLRKYFSQELAVGTTIANTAVAKTLYRMATSGKQPAATMFWLKCRAGWRERPGPEPIRGAPKEKPDGARKGGDGEDNADEIVLEPVPRAA